MAETDKNLKAIKLNDIRNKYILQKIFDFIDKTNSLNIIRYNKAIQNKLDVNIDTYILFHYKLILPNSTCSLGNLKFLFQGLWN